VDVETHLIVAHEVTNIGIDRRQLSSMATRAKGVLGADEPIKVIADQGYYQREELQACEEASITAYVAKSDTSGKRQKGEFNRRQFCYTAEHDEYECPAGERAIYRFTRTECRLLGVSRSGYYAVKTRAESARTLKDRELLGKIKRIHEVSRGVYGSPRITAELADKGVRVGRHKVARLMRLARIRGCPKPRFRATTQRDLHHPVGHNLLQQNFSAGAPNERWVADITYISTNQGWLYLAVVIDLYSRRVVGWSMSQWMSRRLVVDALRMAVDIRQPEGSLVHHSDRGAQYTSDDFREELVKHGIECSMSGRGNCYDNAVAESFFGLLKRERVNRTRYRTREQARADVFDYIEVFYNRRRRHGYLGNISPVDFEKRSTDSLETVH
jgi:transposase InsO family protein